MFSTPWEISVGLGKPKAKVTTGSGALLECDPLDPIEFCAEKPVLVHLCCFDGQV
jgi:hypothetical protein